MIVLEGENLSINYGEKSALKEANIKIESGKIVTIIGPNGSGKSTLIKTLSRYLKPDIGKVSLRGQNITEIHNKSIAQEIAILPQVKHTASDITVENLVSYGRYPHLRFGKRLGREDKNIVDWAIKETGLLDYRDRFVSTLSGGERQRAWIAMALAQKPKILLLDEPTTYLDISYQLEVLELVRNLNKSLGITVVMVLHDLNQAVRYSDYIYVLDEGKVCHHGSPENIMSIDLLKNIFRIEANVYNDEVNDCKYFIPRKIV
ncbi:MAG TPA: ABC transporter ATP-binding protein [Tissierellaceae bacterium]|nr:ABC transporter ATP-binding protein [Tissierellaceae bacterium]